MKYKLFVEGLNEKDCYFFIVGFINFCLVLNMGALHGGLNLYNTGLSAGIVASVSVPILQLFYGGKK